MNENPEIELSNTGSEDQGEIFSPIEIVGIDSIKKNLNNGTKNIKVKVSDVINDTNIENINKDYSSNCEEPMDTNDESAEEEEVFLIPPLLRIRNHGSEEKIPIGIKEIQRRIGPPESLSQALVLSLLRLNKERAKHLRKALAQFGIKELSGKSTVVSSFSRLSEAESISLAEDYYYLSSRFMRVRDMHYSLVHTCEPKESYDKKATQTKQILDEVLTEIEKKSSHLDLLTHGFSPLILKGVFNILSEILTFKENTAPEITFEIQKE